MAISYMKSRELGKVLCEALGLDVNLTKRIIIDCDSSDGNTIPMVYVEMIGDRRLLDIQWTDALKGAEVITTKVKEK